MQGSPGSARVTNTFPRKARVVFRAWAVDSRQTGKAMGNGRDQVRVREDPGPAEPEADLRARTARSATRSTSGAQPGRSRRTIRSASSPSGSSSRRTTTASAPTAAAGRERTAHRHPVALVQGGERHDYEDTARQALTPRPLAAGRPARVPRPRPRPRSRPGSGALDPGRARASRPAAPARCRHRRTWASSRRRPDTGAAGARSRSPAPSSRPASRSPIVWFTSKVDWLLDARPGQRRLHRPAGDEGGRRRARHGHDRCLGLRSASKLKAPRDFGAIHDVYAVIDGVQVAKGGFLIERTLSMSPLRGPVGTMVTIKIGGLGSTLYGGAASVWYDGRYTGVVTGKWTRGEATVQIRAAGPVGEAHDPDRHRDAVQLPEHQAVADPVGDRRLQDVRGHEGRRPAGRPDRPAR